MHLTRLFGLFISLIICFLLQACIADYTVCYELERQKHKSKRKKDCEISNICELHGVKMKVSYSRAIYGRAKTGEKYNQEKFPNAKRKGFEGCTVMSPRKLLVKRYVCSQCNKTMKEEKLVFKSTQ